MMEPTTKEVPCGKPGGKAHSIPVHKDGGKVCGNCGSSRLVHVGTAPKVRYVNGWCEDHSYCRDCRHITWPGHFVNGKYKDGKPVIAKWYSRPATTSQVKQYEH